MKPFDVVTFGEAMAVLSSDANRAIDHNSSLGLSFAGAEANVAIGLTRLGHRVCWQSIVGNDPMGQMIRKRMIGEGLPPEYIRYSSHRPTGLMVKLYAGWSEPTVMYYRDGSAFRHCGGEEFDSEVIRGARVLYLTGITPALSVAWANRALSLVRSAHKHGVSVWFDPNYRRKLWTEIDAQRWYLKVLPFVDVLLCGLTEGQLITGEAALDKVAAALGNRTAANVVLKQGGNGATSFAKKVVIHVPATSVSPVDPIGAGDGFAAGYLSAWLNGFDVTKCLKSGNAVGAMVCLNCGDWEGLPSAGELEAFLQARRESNR